MKFLKNIAEDLLIKQKNSELDLGRTFIILPSKRGILFLQKLLKEKFTSDEPAWSAKTVTISDFISRVSNRIIPDRLSLQLILYNSYKTVCKKNPKTLETFYPWSSVLISDFNDIDQNICDLRIFKNISDNSEFDLPDNPFYKKFNEFSDLFFPLYKEFNSNLDKYNMTYYGKALRELIDKFNETEDFRNNDFVFAGFNRLTKGEELLFKKTSELGRSHFYWEIDSNFINRTYMEAGKYFRKTDLCKNTDTWITDSMSSEEKNIEVIACPQNTGIAKTAGLLLEKDPHITSPEGREDTALILCDESLLFPVLHSIPESVPDINITMGFELKNTPMYTLFKNLFNMQETGRNKNKEQRILFKDAESVLSHPYLIHNNEKEISDLLSENREANTIEVSSAFLEKIPQRVRAFFDSYSDFNSLQQYFENLFSDLREIMINGEFDTDLEFLLSFHKIYNSTSNTIARYTEETTAAFFWKIFLETAESSTIPFTGEPLKGIQIMGMLETRTLEFKNIYILSLNEGLYPRGKGDISFIPEDIKRSFGLSMYEDKESMYAYYFYRLIMNSRNIKILYNTETDGFGKGERSRFIEQLLFELPEMNRKSKIECSSAVFKSVFSSRKKISIEKKSYMEQLLKIEFSPSALKTYLRCPLQFYFRYIRKIYEPEKIVEAPDAAVFGKLAHRALELLYTPYINKAVSPEDLDIISQKTEQAVNRAFADELNIKNTDRGRNFLNRVIINKLIVKLISAERKSPEFKVLDLEKKFKNKITFGNTDVTLKGTADRIDKVGDALRIIDYKTGRVCSLNIKNEDLSDICAVEKLRKKPEAIQLMIYILLVTESEKYSDYDQFRAGIYTFRAVNEGLKELNLDKIKKHNRDIIVKIRNFLSSLFLEIFNPELPFEGVDDPDTCSHCIFKNICIR